MFYRYKSFLLMALVMGGLATPFLGKAWSAEGSDLSVARTAEVPLELEVGKSHILESHTRIRRASVADPKIADALVLSPKQLYLVGNQIGETNVTLWGGDEQVLQVYAVRVKPSLPWLKEQIHELLHEKDIRVEASNDYIALSGSVSNSVNLTHVLTLAEAFAPKKILNLLQVSGGHQVMLEVRIAEMSRTLTRRLGINFNVINGNDFGIAQLGDFSSTESDSDGLSTTFSTIANAIIGIQSGGVTWTSFIAALKAHGLVKILAEPNLVTLSGQQASFLAGGEIPILVSQGLGTNSIVFKKFGVALIFKPTVLSPQKISMEVTPEFSEIDESRATVIGVPSFLTRRVNTVIELGDGQSFAIGGLIKDNVRESLNKYPILGDIPILGALFRSSSFEKDETELIVIVTPHLVKPVDVAKHPLPTSHFVEPDDFSFYFQGALEQPGLIQTPDAFMPSSKPFPRAMFDGELGHVTLEKES